MRLPAWILTAIASSSSSSPMPSILSADAADDQFAAAREQMVREQLETPGRGIKDQRVLRAMRKVERHRFVPDTFAKQAYADHPLPIGHNQTICQPYIVALMSQLPHHTPGEKVL